jgi:hypothetical protein
MKPPTTDQSLASHTVPRLRVAALQMVSTPRVEENLRTAAGLIGEAVAQGAELLALPEYFAIMGLTDADKVNVREFDGSGPIQDFLAASAREHGIWLVGGSLPLWSDNPHRVLNSSLVYNPHGQRVARYDKIHLFGFRQGAECYDESATIEAGRQPVAFNTPFGRDRPVDLLRPQISGALSCARCPRFAGDSGGLHRDHRSRALGNPPARQGDRESVLRTGQRPRVASTRTAARRTATAC